MPVDYRRIVIPVTGGAEDIKVLGLARELSANNSVAITLVYVVEVPQALRLEEELPEELDRGEAVLADAEVRASALLEPESVRISTDLLQARSAGAAIVDEAIELNADAIMMASHVRLLHGKTTTGETANYVMRNAPCDVLILRVAPSTSVLGGR